uniref:Fructose-1,6-bisphosphatase 1 n=1 Tax=Aceria tosichella TaxID=561515 RepID=A0A6G1SDT5_9ACAR
MAQPINPDCMTLTRFLIGEQRKYPTATGELTTLLNALQTAIKSVSSAVRKAGMTNLFGLAKTTNATGDEVKRLDVLSNELFINMLRSSYTVHKMISEENDSIMKLEDDKAGKYFIAFDPLDGSSNIEASVSIGSIFAVYRHDAQKTDLPDGNAIVAAGYALYGSATVIVLAINAGVNCFMLDPAIGEFILTESNIRIKPRGAIYSVNEGYHSKWDQAMKNYVESRKYPKKAGQKPYSSRYVGSMVADMHRTFKYGGIFMYPKTSDAPNGKLRLLYECNPFAFIVEKAGGKAMAAPGRRILDIKPEQIHQRTPIFIGSSEDVDEIMAEYEALG